MCVADDKRSSVSKTRLSHTDVSDKMEVNVLKITVIHTE